jgi:NTP pyrophosphatase (non-canonical NTP hydrolase)
MEELFDKIRVWGAERNLTQNKTPEQRFAQYTKTVEEVAELGVAVAKKDSGLFIDAIGDVVVTLVLQAGLWERNLENIVHIERFYDGEAFHQYRYALLVENVALLGKFINLDDLANVESRLSRTYNILNDIAIGWGVDLEECTQTAYNEIVNRKGRTVNGVFVKENDRGSTRHDQTILNYRLKYIDEVLDKYDQISPAELREQFGIGVTQAGKDIKLYQEKTGTKLYYDTIQRVYKKEIKPTEVQ